MQIIPAIDVSQGRLSRLDSGRRTPVEAFSGDPLEAARSFVSAGATWIHLVDMDRAFDGAATSLKMTSAIAELGVRVQASGGIANADEVTEALEAGAERVVLGSAALANLDLVSSLIERLGERLVVGIETDGGSIRPRGRWGDEPGAPIDLMAAVDAVVGLGARRLLVTHVARVGGLGGTHEAVIRRIIERVGSVPVVASGGAASLAEIEGLKEGGVEAVVIGRALYEGDLDLASAIRASDGAPA